MNLDRTDLDRLFRYCLALTGERSDAQDLLHDALEGYLHRAPGEVGDAVAYVRRSARNRFFNGIHRRGLVRFEALPEDDFNPAQERDLESLVVDELTLATVWQSLSAAEREVVFLWAVEGMSASEIALHLGQPRGTVLARLHRLRRRATANFRDLAGGAS